MPRAAAYGLAAALVVLPARRAGGQGGGFVDTEAVVVTVGMTIAALRDLDFGSVTAGVPSTVQPVAAAAGAWQATGNANAFVIITFTLPAQLVNIQAAPGSTMPITFANNSARWRRANSDPTGAFAFNPNIGTLGRFGPPPNPTLYLWIGGTVNPPPAAKPGIYQGTIIATLDYLF